jgi:isochorismate pyruvate lyase
MSGVGNKPGDDADGWRAECASLADVRGHIDRLDNIIAPLLCQRLFFVQQAAKFKPSKEGVVVPARVEEIVRSVRAVAEKYQMNPDVLEHIYRIIIDDFTAEEKKNWDKLHAKP